MKDHGQTLRTQESTHLRLTAPLGGALHTVAVLLELVGRHEAVIRRTGHVLAVDAGKERQEVVPVIAHELRRDTADVVRVVCLGSEGVYTKDRAESS
jgi:hypothetical protein